ncbi:hypothetical protein F5883DRAFT_207659 [Diaporthe sp. PMI_573]|nr:hypothetical protein F5883DRAFT_207659 [Diaporthaceae sp. PMI_573]
MLTPTQTVAMEWGFFVLAFSFLLARFWVRFSLRQYQAWVSDVLLVIALVCTVGNIMCDTLIYKVDGLLEYKHVTQYLGKVRFSTKFFFDAGLYFPKFSLVMSYATMVPVTEPRMRIFLRFIAAYLVLACLTAVFADLFWCGGDVSINWLNPLKCSSSNPHLQKVAWTMNIVGELLLFIFPFPILNSLKFTQLREKIGLGLIFALGFFTILVSTGRFMFMIFLTNDISLSVWTTVEMCISIMVVSLVAMRPLLRRFGHAMTKTISKIRKDSREQRYKEPRLPSYIGGDMSEEKTPLPYNTDRWWKWPVDLDINTMSVTTTTKSGSVGTQRTGMSTKMSTRGSRMSRNATKHDTGGAMLRSSEEPLGLMEMDAQEVHVDNNLVIDNDQEGLPYGA